MGSVLCQTCKRMCRSRVGRIITGDEDSSHWRLSHSNNYYSYN